MLSIFINILLVIHVFVSVLMLLVVLMQRPKSEGLGAAFGGGMTENIFGAQTTNVLTKFTVWLGCSFFVLTLTLAVLYAQQSRGEGRVTPTLLQETSAPAKDAMNPTPQAKPAMTPPVTVVPETGSDTAPAMTPPVTVVPDTATDTAPEMMPPATQVPAENVMPDLAPAMEDAAQEVQPESATPAVETPQPAQ